MIDGVFYNKEIIDFEKILRGIIEIVGEDVVNTSIDGSGSVVNPRINLANLQENNIFLFTLKNKTLSGIDNSIKGIGRLDIGSYAEIRWYAGENATAIFKRNGTGYLTLISIGVLLLEFKFDSVLSVTVVGSVNPTPKNCNF